MYGYETISKWKKHIQSTNICIWGEKRISTLCLYIERAGMIFKKLILRSRGLKNRCSSENFSTIPFVIFWTLYKDYVVFIFKK